MALLTRNAPPPSAPDPSAEFEARHAELLAKLNGMRKALNEARSELADETLAELVGTGSPGRVSKLEAKVSKLDRDVADLEVTVDRSRSVMSRFLAARDQATWAATVDARRTVRGAWIVAVERQQAVLRDFLDGQARIAALEEEDRAAARLQDQLAERSKIAGRVMPAATGATFAVLTPEHTPQLLADALERLRREPTE